MQPWWQGEPRPRLVASPCSICDGQSHDALLHDAAIEPASLRSEANSCPSSSPTQSPLRLPTDDSPVEWPQLMPEQCCRPHLWPSDQDPRVGSGPGSEGWPEGHVRVVVTGNQNRVPANCIATGSIRRPDYITAKADDQGFDLRTQQARVPSTPSNTTEFVKSPSGIWYPQTGSATRRRTVAPEWHGLTQFYVDFDAELHSDLFRPVSKP